MDEEVNFRWYIDGGITYPIDIDAPFYSWPHANVPGRYGIEAILKLEADGRPNDAAVALDLFMHWASSPHGQVFWIEARNSLRKHGLLPASARGVLRIALALHYCPNGGGRSPLEDSRINMVTGIIMEGRQ